MKSRAPQKLVPFANVNLMPFKWGLHETIKILVKSHEHSKKGNALFFVKSHEHSKKRERAFFVKSQRGSKKYVFSNFSREIT